MLTDKSADCPYIAYKSAVLIDSIPPPEIVSIVLPQSFRTAICCMPKQKAFVDMPRVMYSCIVRSLSHRFAAERDDCQIALPAMLEALKVKLPNAKPAPLLKPSVKIEYRLFIIF